VQDKLSVASNQLVPLIRFDITPACARHPAVKYTALMRCIDEG